MLGELRGQPEAVEMLACAARAPVHAYLLVGPPGCGKRAAAAAFAACLVCPDGGCGSCRHCRLALAGQHPDVAVVERSGAAVRIDEVREVTRLATRAPMEAARQVVVVTEMHLIDRAASALLKTVEEPPPSTFFVLVAEDIPPSLRTIASRCVVVRFGALGTGQVRQALLDEGVDPGLAAEAASASGGRLDRARLLSADDSVSARRALWAGIPARLDGSGATVALIAAELLAATDAAAGPVRLAQAAESEALRKAARETAQQGVPGRSETEERHRRELRRARTDELRSGLSCLVEAYRDRLRSALESPRSERGTGSHESRSLLAAEAVEEAARGLARNPNEALLLQALLLRLSSLAEGSVPAPSRWTVGAPQARRR
ncbi:MAG: hypothetical protein ACRDYD_07145 [Acidimicrobiales bacterium]